MRWRGLGFGPRLAVQAAVCLAACVAIYVLVGRTVAAEPTFVVMWRGQPVTFLDPAWFRLVAIAPVFYLLRTFSLTDLSLAQQLLQASLRSLLVLGIAAALARPSRITDDNKVATIIAIDVSDSVSDRQLASARSYVDELDKAKGNGKLIALTFAEKPKLVTPTQGQAVSAAISRHVGAGAGTDLVAALQLAYGIFPDGYLPNLVVVSDGIQTNGDIATEALRAKELGIAISWRMFTADKTSEVRVIGLAVPDDIKVGQPFEITAEVWSTQAQTVSLALAQDEFPNPLEPAKTVALTEGKNFIKFKSDAKRAGATTYRLRLTSVEHDTVTSNNASVMTAPVKGKPRILYIEGGVLRDPATASHMKRALEHENIDVDVGGPSRLASNAKSLEVYDLVLFSDVPAHLIGAGQMQALDTYVSQFGGGLIVAGGEDSFGSGGYQGTRIEQMLPVRFDSEKTREQPDIALMLVIDRSGSMQGAKLEAAKESARVTAEVLSPGDVIGVVAFDTDAATYVRPQRAANRMRISAEISRLQSGGGTDIRPGLKMAHEALQSINAKIKHVIVLSDGEAPTAGLQDIVQDMRASRITVSCVGVAGADRNLLSLIANAGDGRLYMVEDIGALPKIFMKETMEAQKSQLVEDLVSVRVAKRVEAIDGTNVESAPPLHGYVSTKPKPTAETILISDLGEPILARWRRGAGFAVAWTSDVKNRWSVDWIRWGGYPKFWAQLVRSSMRRQVYNSYDLAAVVVDGKAQVTVDAIDSGDRFVNELDTDLEVIDPATNKVVKTLAMQQTAAGRYSAEFSLDRYGSYLLKAIHKRGGTKIAESMGAVALSYPLEYLQSTPAPEALQHAAAATGGVNQAAPSQVWQPGDRRISYTQDLWPYVVLVCIGLFLLDLFAKRVRLFGYRTIRFS